MARNLYERNELVVYANPAENGHPNVVKYIKLFARGSDHAVVRKLWHPHNLMTVPLSLLSKHPMNQ